VIPCDAGSPEMGSHKELYASLTFNLLKVVGKLTL